MPPSLLIFVLITITVALSHLIFNGINFFPFVILFLHYVDAHHDFIQGLPFKVLLVLAMFVLIFIFHDVAFGSERLEHAANDHDDTKDSNLHGCKEQIIHGGLEVRNPGRNNYGRDTYDSDGHISK